MGLLPALVSVLICSGLGDHFGCESAVANSLSVVYVMINWSYLHQVSYMCKYAVITTEVLFKIC